MYAIHGHISHKHLGDAATREHLNADVLQDRIDQAQQQTHQTNDETYMWDMFVMS